MSMYFGDYVIPPLLAQLSDLEAWTGTAPPSNATQILRACTTIILEESAGAYYTVDPTTGLATDMQIATALTNATCIQAAAWIALNIDPNLGGVTTATVKSSKRLATAAFTMEPGDAASAAQARAYAQQFAVPMARKMLIQNNLIGDGPYAL